MASKTPPQLIQENQGLVASLARRIHRTLPPSIELEDLIAYGQQGLVEAAAGYDPAKGGQFSTYAYYRVRGAIYDGLSKMNWFSRAQYKQARNQQLADDVLRLESDESGSDSSGDKLENDVRWLKRTSGTLSVVYLMTQQDDDQQGDPMAIEDPSAIAPSAEATQHEIRDVLHKLVDELPTEAAALIQGVYFEGLTLQEAGKRIGVSKAWASRLHARTLERLARSLRRVGVDAD